MEEFSFLFFIQMYHVSQSKQSSYDIAGCGSQVYGRQVYDHYPLGKCHESLLDGHNYVIEREANHCLSYVMGMYTLSDEWPIPV